MSCITWHKVLVETDIASVHLILAQWLFGEISPKSITKAAKTCSEYWQQMRFGCPHYWTDAQIYELVSWYRLNH